MICTARASVRWSALTLATMLVLAACGDDGDDSEAQTGGTEATEATEAGTTATDAEATTTTMDPATAAACDAYVALEQAFNIDEDPDAGLAAIEDFVAAAPSEVAEAVEPLIPLLQENVEAALESTEIVTAEKAIDQYAFDTCGDTRVEIEGIDFAFSGIPSEMDAGRVVFDFTNKSQSGEFHEVLVLRKSDAVEGSSYEALVDALAGAPTSIEAALAALAQLELVAVGFVEPEGGDTEDVFAADLEPGEYVFACLLPVNSPETLDAYFAGEEVDGGRHFDESMYTAVTVR